MVIRNLVPWVLMSGLLLTASAQAQSSLGKVVTSGKSATALVNLRNSSGTAFCVHPSGLFVTNHHVVDGARGSVSLVLNPGTKSQKVLKAKVVRSDAKNDLALLRAEKSKDDYPTLTLGDDGKVTELGRVIAFGYPFGTALGIKGEYPNISVNMGSITSLRKQKGVLQRIQLDASLNPGNSGGPVLNDKGEVLGVVEAGIRGAGVNFAIPVSHVRAFLDKPDISVTLPQVTLANRYKPAKFQVQASLVIPSEKKLEVEMVLRSKSGERKLKVQPGKDGLFTALAAPFVKPAAQQELSATVVFGGGSKISGKVADLSVKIGTETKQLSEIREIEFGKTPTATLTTGEKITGAFGLSKIAVNVGGAELNLGLAKATKLEIQAPPQESRVLCLLVAKLDGKEIYREESPLSVGSTSVVSTTPGPGPGPGPQPVDIDPPDAVGEKVDVRLPASVRDVCTGGGGRYMILHFDSLKKLGIFDLSTRKLAGYVPAGDEGIFAAGQTKLMVVYPNLKTIKKYNLATRKLEKSVVLGLENTIKSAVMGSASEGPLVLVTGDRFRLKTAFFDPLTMAMSTIKMPERSRFDGDRFRASGDGRVVTAWRVGTSPSGISSLVLNGKKAEVFYEHDSAGYLVPSADGRLIFTSRGGTHTEKAKKADGKYTGVPAELYPYHLEIPQLDFRDAKPTGVRVYINGDKRPVTYLKQVTGFRKIDRMNRGSWGREMLTFDKRIQFAPQFNVIACLAPSDDLISLFPFDMDNALKEWGQEYMVAPVSPIQWAKLGDKFSTKVVAKSNSDKITYELVSAPEGMKIDNDGHISWDVPSQYAEPEFKVLVQISNDAGKQTFHSLTLRMYK